MLLNLWTPIVLLNLSCCMRTVCTLSTRCMYNVNQLDRLLWIFLHAACMKSARCLHAVHHFAWDTVGNMVLSTQNNGFHTNFELEGGGASSVHVAFEVLVFPGICMEENGHKMEF